mmetsp:Transcript_56347/g.167615  ORF Transcript_56347/g.167615 Transcript_56347/m.167615 type:complete len:239 (+) Transcript_56347:243-959(+)
MTAGTAGTSGCGAATLRASIADMWSLILWRRSLSTSDTLLDLSSTPSGTVCMSNLRPSRYLSMALWAWPCCAKARPSPTKVSPLSVRSSSFASALPRSMQSRRLLGGLKRTRPSMPSAEGLLPLPAGCGSRGLPGSPPLSNAASPPLPGTGQPPLPGRTSSPLLEDWQPPLPGNGSAPLPGSGSQPLPRGWHPPLPTAWQAPLPGGSSPPFSTPLPKAWKPPLLGGSSPPFSPPLPKA